MKKVKNQKIQRTIRRIVSCVFDEDTDEVWVVAIASDNTIWNAHYDLNEGILHGWKHLEFPELPQS